MCEGAGRRIDAGAIASRAVTLPKNLVLSTLVCTGALAGLGGCGTTTIDATKAEKGIRKAVTEQAHARVKTVSCPSGKEAKAGATLTCKVVGTDGSTGNALIKEKNDKGDVSIDAPFVHPRDIENGVAASIKRQAGVAAVKVTCPEIVPAQAGAKTTCQAVSGATKANVLITQTNGKGGFNFKVQSNGGG
jgi:hypothetical protein